MKAPISRFAHPRASLRWSRLPWQGFAGFWLGYTVLHPVSMVIFYCLDPHFATATPHGKTGGIWAPIAHSFSVEMLSMGLVFGIVGAFITTLFGCHRLALAAERDRMAEELELNEQLRAELTEQAKRLTESNEEMVSLETANRRTIQFMAHDFRTALNCVDGFANVLYENPALKENQDVIEAIACIHRQTHRMMGSLTDLLEFARARDGVVPQMQRISATEILHEAARDFSLPAHTGEIALGEQHASCPALWGDPLLLHRVVCNLIFNAIKHNSPTTDVFLDARVDKSGTKVLFSCRDNGNGVAPDILPTIFTEFVTTDDSYSKSTGLGLALCRVAVEAHGGRIWCENSPRGAAFLFTVPLHTEDEDGH